jgi:Tfp pilus assembly protein PilE
MKKNKKLRTNLVELIIILVVIGILSFINYQQFALAQAKSRDVQRKSDLNEFSKVILEYQADYNKLPSDELINKLWGKNFVDKGYVYAASVPKEKYGNEEYCYEAGKDGTSFKMFAELEDKSDPDCKKDELLCRGVKYCYTDIIYVGKTVAN